MHDPKVLFRTLGDFDWGPRSGSFQITAAKDNKGSERARPDLGCNVPPSTP